MGERKLIFYMILFSGLSFLKKIVSLSDSKMLLSRLVKYVGNVNVFVIF